MGIIWVYLILAYTTQGSCSGDSPTVVGVLIPGRTGHVLPTNPLEKLGQLTDAIICVRRDDASASANNPALPLLSHNLRWERNAATVLNAAAVRAAKAGARWMVTLTDSEDLVVNTTEWRAQLATSEEDVLMCRLGWTDNPHARACAFKLPLRGVFDGPVTAVFLPDEVTVVSPPLAAGVMIWPEATGNDEDLRRDVNVLRRTLAATQHLPTRSWRLLELAFAYDALQRHDLAIKHYQLAHNAAKSRAMAAWAMHDLSRLLTNRGQHQEAVTAAWQGVACTPSPELLWLAGLSNHRRKKHDQAVACAEMAAALGCSSLPSRAGGACDVSIAGVFLNIHAWHDQPFDVMRLSYRALGQDASADAAEVAWHVANAQRAALGRGGRLNTTVAGLQRLPYLAREDQVVVSTPSTKPKIAVSITTAHRPELFRRAWLSFLLRCLDCDAMVDRYYIVDDGSSPAQLAEMQRAAPESDHVVYLAKRPGQEGHVGSLNALLDEVLQEGFEYLLTLEDDWFFIDEGNLVTDALRVLAFDATLSQVLFNRRYADTDADWELAKLAHEDELITSDGLRYMRHVYGGPFDTPAWWACMNARAKPGQLGNCHWPGFSLRPGVWRLSAVRLAAYPFVDTGWFEEKVGLKLMDAGYYTGMLDGVACIHLVPTKEWIQAYDVDGVFRRHGLLMKHGGAFASAYEASGTVR